MPSPLKVKCPRCGREFTIEVDRRLLESARENPSGLHPVALPHEDHVLIAYIDENGNLRRLEAFPSVRTEAPPSEPEYIPVPRPRGLMPDLKRLRPEELRVLVFCDGKRTLREIAAMLGMRYETVKVIVTKLHAQGYLAEVKIRLS